MEQSQDTGSLHGIEGRAFVGNTSRAVPARLTAHNDHVRLFDYDGTLITKAPRVDIDFDAPLGRAPRRLTFPDGSMFETEDHDAIALLAGRTFWDRLHGFETFGPRLILFVIGALVGVWLLYAYALTGVVNLAVALTPKPVLTAMDAGTLQTLDATLADPSELSDDQKAEAQQVFDDLIAALPAEQREAHDYELLFRAFPPAAGPNAAALPGGTVILTDALVNSFDEDVVATVLGHEIGHVVAEHGLRRLYRSLGIFILVALIAGDTGPILEDIVLEGNILLSLSFSRENERDADDFGLRLADAAGYDPAGLQTFFVTLQKEFGDGGGWLSSHPGAAERVQRIEEYLNSR